MGKVKDLTIEPCASCNLAPQLMRPDCKFYSYGDVAPREYGAYCTYNNANVEITSQDTCSGCEAYAYPDDTFDGWLAKPSVRKTLRTLWEDIK